jgi:hypothetical protein
LLALLGGATIVVVSRLRVKFRRRISTLSLRGYEAQTFQSGSVNETASDRIILKWAGFMTGSLISATKTANFGSL